MLASLSIRFTNFVKAGLKFTVTRSFKNVMYSSLSKNTLKGTFDYLAILSRYQLELLLGPELWTLIS